MATKVELQVATLKTEFEEVRKQNVIDHRAILSALDDLKADFCSFKDNADKKYASKMVEKIVYAMIGIIVVSVLYLILKGVGISPQ
jgi:hypothetical protein